MPGRGHVTAMGPPVYKTPLYHDNCTRMLLANHPQVGLAFSTNVERLKCRNSTGPTGAMFLLFRAPPKYAMLPPITGKAVGNGVATELKF